MAPPPSSTSKNPFTSLLSQVALQVNPRLVQVTQKSEDDARKYGTEVGQMAQAVRSLCERGGKRLRPGLCAVGMLAEDSQIDITPAIEAGVSLELLQAYFLIHDDWMDEDDERRGGPTAHIELGRQLKSKSLGERSAILAGDHALALATAQLVHISTSPARLKKVLGTFAAMQLDAVAGQQLDIVGETKDPELTYRLKTASYTVRGPLLLGAELAGAQEKTKRILDAFSLPAGIAFQLRDDLIGVFEETSQTGKPQGGDLKEGKNTTLVVEGRKRLNHRGKELLKTVLGNSRATAPQLHELISSLEECGARQAVEERIASLKADAQQVLMDTHLSDKSLSLLKGAITALADRKV